METGNTCGRSAACPYTGRQFTNVGLEQLRRALAISATDRGWTEQHTPRNLLLALVAEVGQLAGIFQWRGELPPGLASSLPAVEQQQLAQELSDVLLYLLRLADVCGVDLGRAALAKLADNAARFPKQQQQSAAPNTNNESFATSTASSASSTLPALVQHQQPQAAPVSSLSSGLRHLQQQQQLHRLSPVREARQHSSGASSPSSSQQQPPSAAGFIRSLPASPRQQQQPPLQLAQLRLASPNLADGIISYERCSRSPSPVAAAAAAAAAGSPARLGSPGQLSPRSMASLMQLDAVTTPSVSPASSPMLFSNSAQQQHQQLESFLGVAASSSSSSQLPGDDEALHSSKATRLLPQGLLDEIGHSLQLGPAAAAAAAAGSAGADGGGNSKQECCSSNAGVGVHHARVVSIGDSITPPLHCSSNSLWLSGNAAAAPPTPSAAGTSRSGSLSNSSSAGSKNSSTSAAAAAAVTAASAAASAAAAGSAAASLWLTAAAGGDAGQPALPGVLASQQGSATALTSCGTSQLSWGIFSASSAEHSIGAASSHGGGGGEGDGSEAGSERSSTPPAAGYGSERSSSGCMLQDMDVQAMMGLGGLRAASGSVQPGTAAGAAGLLHSPQQHQQTAAGSASVGGVPVRSMAAAAAAAAAASGIAPVDHAAAAAAVQQLAAGMTPLDGCSFELCPRCGRLHGGGCDAAKKATCPRCYRKAHLGECWSRCICCNLVHAPGKCRASSSGAVGRGRRDQQQQQQTQTQQQQSDAAAAACSAVTVAGDEDLEKFPSLSEGMAGSGAPAAAAVQPAPPNAQLVFGSRLGRYIRDLATLVVAYGVSINLVEVTWKSKIKAQFPNPNDYSAFMGDFSTATGAVTFTMMILSRYIFKYFGWGTAALITPVVLLITGIAFFSLVLFSDSVAPTLKALGLTPLMAAVLVGAAQNVFSKSSKYSLFDPCKEMAYIPLDDEVKVKGKAAIDVICNPLGKSGGALIQQFMIIGFGSLAASTPYLGVILLSIVLLWINAANSLAGQFGELQGKEESESMDAAGTQTFKYVLEAGSSKGKWVPVAKGESPAGQTKVMTQAEADAMNQ